MLVTAALHRGGDETEATDPLALAGKALVQIGYPPPVATSTIERVRAHVDVGTGLDAIIKEALRFCS